MDEYNEYSELGKLTGSSTNLVFVFGYTGSGKTCFLVALYEYLFRSCALLLNSTDNKGGISYIQTLSRDLREKAELPPQTAIGSIVEFDFTFKDP